jgi:serine/threonine-protein kinase
VHDFGITPKSIAYLVMEWLDGSNLDPVIRIGGTISLARFLHIFIQATSALAHAHRKGVIHRDIKPSNLILATTPERPDFVKVVDFGIAKVLSEEDDAMNLTRTGDILGSPLYMSPEQCMGNKMDARSDIYSLGCVMYQALVGITPLKGENAVQLIFRHVHDMPPRPSSIKADIELPEVMEPLLFKCLQKDPAKRFSTMDELEAELKRVQDILKNMA